MKVVNYKDVLPVVMDNEMIKNLCLSDSFGST